MQSFVGVKSVPYKLIVALTWLSSQDVGAQGALMPAPDTDLSAHRLDAEVFGWSSDFSEVAALGQEVRRFPRGKQRGETFLLVYDVSTWQPKDNVHVHYITQADMPHDPLPIMDVRKLLWNIDHQFQRMWPRRPKRKHYRGAMRVEFRWHSEEPERGVCRPHGGFLLRKGKRTRFVSPRPLDIKADCGLLRHTDTRTYWGTPDSAVAMVRFDYSSSAINEQSVRLPLSIRWTDGVPVELVLISDLAPDHPRYQRAHQALAKVAPPKRSGGVGDRAQGVVVRAELAALGQQVAQALELPLRVGGTGLEVIVRATDGPAPAASPAPPKTEGSNSYLDDFSP